MFWVITWVDIHQVLYTRCVKGGTWWCGWLRHCSISWKVVGLIPNCVTGIFHWHNPSGRTMTLGSTQPLTEMSTRNNFWAKGNSCIGLTTLPPSCVDCLKIWELNLLEPWGSVTGLFRDCLTLVFQGDTGSLYRDSSWGLRVQVKFNVHVGSVWKGVMAVQKYVNEGC
jgi:hypothetical protein